MERAIFGGHTPIDLNRNYAQVGNVSESGQFLGKYTTRRGYATDYSWQNLSASWVHNTFEPWIDYLENGTLFMAWRPLTYDAGAVYGWTEGMPQASNMGVSDRMSLTMKIKGYRGRTY
jgi:hypothetical protein